MKTGWLGLLGALGASSALAGPVPATTVSAPSSSSTSVEPPALAGDYVMVVQTSTRSRVPVAGTTDVITRSLVRVQLRQKDQSWTQEHKVCAIDIWTDTRAETVLPDAFIASLPVKRYPVTLERGAGGWAYTATPEPNFIGYDPAVSGGALPERRSDAGVLDFDGDGHPGATVLLDVPVLGSVRMYIVQKGHSRYHGELKPDGSIEGRIEVLETAQVTLGASVPLFAASPTITPVPAGSRFRLVPVDESETCSSLAEKWDRTFETP